VEQHNSLSTKRVLFGKGIRRSVADEMRLLGASRALVLSTPNQNADAQEIVEVLGSLAAGAFCKAAMHTPVNVTEEALGCLRQLGADCLIAIGGGSTTGLGKALAYRTDVLQIAIPTTYAGSEATPILGQTENGVKTTLTDPRVLPDVILYDPELLTSLPVDMTVTSALNAMAHAAEALYAPNRTTQTDALAVEGLRTFINTLPSVTSSPHDVHIRTETQRGTWACGTVLGHVGMGLHHKLCHTLGGTFNLPHAQTHAVILPHAIAYNQRSAAAELQPICDLLNNNNAGLALHHFAAGLNAPMSLADLGLQETDLDRAADLATQKPYPNPHPVTHKDIRALLQAAWAGTTPVL
jgi:maleylacetate reductase